MSQSYLYVMEKEDLWTHNYSSKIGVGKQTLDFLYLSLSIPCKMLFIPVFIFLNNPGRILFVLEKGREDESVLKICKRNYIIVFVL